MDSNPRRAKAVTDIYNFSIQTWLFHGFVVAKIQHGVSLSKAADDFIEYYDPEYNMSKESLLRAFYTFNEAYINHKKTNGK